jgi:hypothetical protein
MSPSTFGSLKNRIGTLKGNWHSFLLGFKMNKMISLTRTTTPSALFLKYFIAQNLWRHKLIISSQANTFAVLRISISGFNT